MIVKNQELKQLAQAVFCNTGITIEVEGERHLGAAIGSPEFKEKYMKKKVDSWTEDVEQLSYYFGHKILNCRDRFRSHGDALQWFQPGFDSRYSIEKPLH